MKKSNRPVSFKAFVRPRFFHGQLLSLTDFQRLLSYPSEKMKMVHRLIHGWGILHGLYPQQLEIDGGHLNVVLSPGAGLDGGGREIVVPDTRGNQIKGPFRDGRYFLHLHYAESESTPMPALANNEVDTHTCANSRVTEHYRLELTPELPAMRDALLEGEVVYRQPHKPQAAATPVGGARISALRGKVEEAWSTTDEHGRFSLAVPAGDYVIQIENPDSKGPSVQHRQRVLPRQREHLTLVLSEPAGPFDALALKRRLARAGLPGEPQQEVPDCRIFLAVIHIQGSRVSLDEAETLDRRAQILSHPLLQSILLQHLHCRDNPHQVTAAQIGALAGLNGVPAHNGQFNLKCRDGSIDCTPMPGRGALDLRLADGQVQGRHLAASLLTSDDPLLRVERRPNGAMALWLDWKEGKHLFGGRHLADGSLSSSDRSLHISRDFDGSWDLKLDPGLRNEMSQAKTTNLPQLGCEDGSLQINARENGWDLRLDPQILPGLAKDRQPRPEDFVSSDHSLQFSRDESGRLDMRLAQPPVPDNPSSPTVVTGLCNMVLGAGGRSETRWIHHPFGRKTVFVHLGLEASWSETDELEHPNDFGNYLVVGDLAAIPQFRKFPGFHNAPKLAAQVDIPGERFKLFAVNTGWSRRHLSVRWWVFDHGHDYGWKDTHRQTLQKNR